MSTLKTEMHHLVSNVQLVKWNLLQKERLIQDYLALKSNSRRASLITKGTLFVYIDSKLKSSRTCLIGYSGFISCEWFFIAWGTGTHTRTRMHTHAHTQTDFPDKSNFKKQREHQPETGACLV